MRTKNGSKRKVVFSNTYNKQLFNDCKRALAEERGVPESEIDNEATWSEYNWEMDNDYNNVVVELQMLEMDVETDCLLVGRVGTWKGGAHGGKDVSISNLLSSMVNCDEIEVYAENKRIYMDGHHHDGSHHMELRVRRDGISDETWNDMAREYYERAENVTKSAYPYFKKHYGW